MDSLTRLSPGRFWIENVKILLERNVTRCAKTGGLYTLDKFENTSQNITKQFFRNITNDAYSTKNVNSIVRDSHTFSLFNKGQLLAKLRSSCPAAINIHSRSISKRSVTINVDARTKHSPFHTTPSSIHKYTVQTSHVYFPKAFFVKLKPEKSLQRYPWFPLTRLSPFSRLLRCSRPYSNISTTHNRLQQNPNRPHRPTKAELLANATGFFNRMMIRIKYTLMRQVRPFTMDDIMAMFSWVFVGNTLFIIVGTTSFFSLLLATANSLQFQEFIARQIGSYLTRETGITVVFESAIVPNWKEGKISLKNVSVKRSHSSKDYRTPPFVVFAEGEIEEEQCDNNFTMFDLTIEKIDVELSFVRWLDRKGLIKSAVVKGVRGVVDRRSVHWDSCVPYIAQEWRRLAQPGDFEIDSFHIEDLLITIYQPGNFRPYNIAIFHAYLPRLRQQWLMYDMLCAKSITGTFDNCLFSVHSASIREDRLGGEGQWKKMSRLRIDGLNIDHLNTGVPGPFGWICSGSVDLHADLMIPDDTYDDVIKKLVNDIVEKIDDVVVQQKPVVIWRRNDNVDCNWEHHNIDDNISGISGSVNSNEAESQEEEREEQADSMLKADLSVRFHDVKASVPLVAENLSFIDSALIRPIAAYINGNRTLISMKFEIVKNLSDFDGSWTLYDCGLAEDVSIMIGRCFADLTMDEQKRHKRLKRVGVWGLQTMTKNLVNIWDYATGQRGFWHYIGTIPGYA